MHPYSIQWEINVFLHLLSCFSESWAHPPPSLSVFRRFIPEAVVQYQNYHINQSTNVWAVDLMPAGFSLCLFVSLCFNICLSMPHLSLAHLFLWFHLVLKNDLEQKWGMYKFQKHAFTVGLLFFFTVSELISKLISKPKIRDLLTVKDSWNKKTVIESKFVWMAHKSCSVLIHVNI